MPPPPRVWPVFVTFVVVLPVAGVVALAALIATVGLGDLLSDPEVLYRLPVLLAASAATELVLVGAVLVAARPLTRARLRLQRGRASVAVLVAAALGGVALSHVLDTLIALAGLGESGSLGMLSRAMQGAHGGSLVYALVVIALLAGTAEELFFRGFMQTRLSQRWSSRTAVLVTALFFGVMHMDPVHSPLALCLGIWLGFVCERSGSLWPALLAHVVNNTVATLFTGAAVPLFVVGVSLLVFVLCAAWLRRALPPVPLMPPPVVEASVPGAPQPL